jgi:hypothetical protein
MVADLSVLDRAQINGWPQIALSIDRSLHFFLEFHATVRHYPLKSFAIESPFLQDTRVKDVMAQCIGFQWTTDIRNF